MALEIDLTLDISIPMLYPLFNLTTRWCLSADSYLGIRIPDTSSSHVSTVIVPPIVTFERASISSTSLLYPFESPTSCDKTYRSYYYSYVPCICVYVLCADTLTGTCCDTCKT